MYRIAWNDAEGGEHEEDWGSIEAFRRWAAEEGLRLRYTAYAEDDDGEWAVVEKGRC